MAREATKRAPSARTRRAGPKAGRARSKPARAVAKPDVAPESERAPGRGKYDRSRSADERHKEQLDRLLDAAGHVFAEAGWADATVEAIVNRAGMSRRTFYEHFDDLKDCLLTFHQRATRRAFRAVETVVSNADTSRPGEMLNLGVRGFLGGIAMFPHVARVIFRVVRAAGPEFEAVHEQMIGRFVKLVQDGVERAHKLGRTAIPPDELRTFALVSGMEAVAMRYVMRGEEAKAMEAAPILIDMVQRTFGGTPAPT
ncbi:MAG: TetR/AcrR family transcriptional regulator [Labilithrix sp.]|nr:TetR/AcrR family transcriptional regulator [Labilithrix sp.]